MINYLNCLHALKDKKHSEFGDKESKEAMIKYSFPINGLWWHVEMCDGKRGKDQRGDWWELSHGVLSHEHRVWHVKVTPDMVTIVQKKVSAA